VPKDIPRDFILKLNKDTIAAGTSPEIAASCWLLGATSPTEQQTREICGLAQSCR
jgi:hypothetical protein